MYESFYGLKEKPFSLLPDPAYIYLTKQHEMAISLLEYSLENQAGFCVISGKAGTGKTTLLRRLLNQIGNDVSVGLISNTHSSFGELLRWILHAFNLQVSDKNRAQLHQIFVEYLIDQYSKKRRTMLIIDEAQNMSPSALEELRMLSNINSEKDLVLQVILVGQPPLREILQRPDLEQFAQRVAIDYHLESLSLEDTHGYIRHRIKIAGGERDLFMDDACDAVFEHSGGIPRLVNLLCDYALVYAYAVQAAVVTGELVEQVVIERNKNKALPIFSKNPRIKSQVSSNSTHSSSLQSKTSTDSARPIQKSQNSYAQPDVRSVVAISGHGKVSRPETDTSFRNSAQAINTTRGGNFQQEASHSESKEAKFPLPGGLAQRNHMAAPSTGHTNNMPEAYSGTNEKLMKEKLSAPQKNIASNGTNSTSRGQNFDDVATGQTNNIANSDNFGSEKSRQRIPETDTSSETVSEKVSFTPELKSSQSRTMNSDITSNPTVTSDRDKSSSTHSVKKSTMKHRGKERRSGMRATPIARRLLPAAVVIGLLLTAPIVWRSFNQQPASESVSSGAASQDSDVSAATVAQTKPTNTEPKRDQSSMKKSSERNTQIQNTKVDAALSKNSAINEAKLEKMRSERDAALAIARAAERERKALVAAAQARERALKAERKAAIAQEREKAYQAALAAEKAKQEARAAEAAATLLRKKSEMNKTPPDVVSETAVSKTPRENTESKNLAEEKVSEETSKPTAFTANPCKGPSARFLSTCN